MASDLNSLPIGIKRVQAKFAQVHNMKEYYTRVLENLRLENLELLAVTL